MFSKKMLTEDIEKMGLCPSDAVMIHSSMKAIGEVENGADTVVDTLMEYFKNGLLMMPAHTWAQMGKEHRIFEPQTEKSCVGIIPEIFRQRKGVVRSLHPTHSMAVFGNKAEEYVKGEEQCTTPCTPGGCWDRLKDVRAKILLVGVTHARNTFIHAVEENFCVPERFTKEPEQFFIRMPDGTLKETFMYRHFNPNTAHISESYDKLTEAFYETKAARKGYLGNAECILCDAQAVYDVTGRIISHELNCLMDRDVIPKEWW